MGLSATALTAVSAFTANLFPPLAGTGILASDIEAGLQALLNRTLYLKNRINALIDTFSYSYDDDETPGVYAEGIGTTSYSDSATVKLDIASCLVGDILIISTWANISKSLSAGANDAYLRLAVTQDVGGTPSTAAVPGAKLYLYDTGVYMAALGGAVTITAAGTARVLFQGKVGTVGDSIRLGVHAARISVTRIRYGAP